MQRLGKNKLLSYKTQLEARRKAYGLTIRAYESSNMALLPMNESSFGNKAFEDYFKRIILRQLAQLCEYENVIDRLKELG